MQLTTAESGRLLRDNKYRWSMPEPSRTRTIKDKHQLYSTGKGGMFAINLQLTTAGNICNQ